MNKDSKDLTTNTKKVLKKFKCCMQQYIDSNQRKVLLTKIWFKIELNIYTKQGWQMFNFC